VGRADHAAVPLLGFGFWHPKRCTAHLAFCIPVSYADGCVVLGWRTLSPHRHLPTLTPATTRHPAPPGVDDGEKWAEPGTEQFLDIYSHTITACTPCLLSGREKAKKERKRQAPPPPPLLLLPPASRKTNRRTGAKLTILLCRAVAAAGGSPLRPRSTCGDAPQHHCWIFISRRAGRFGGRSSGLSHQGRGGSSTLRGRKTPNISCWFAYRGDMCHLPVAIGRRAYFLPSTSPIMHATRTGRAHPQTPCLGTEHISQCLPDAFPTAPHHPHPTPPTAVHTRYPATRRWCGTHTPLPSHVRALRELCRCARARCAPRGTLTLVDISPALPTLPFFILSLYVELPHHWFHC